MKRSFGDRTLGITRIARMSRFHAVVWLDHRQARIFHVGVNGADEAVLRRHDVAPHTRHKANLIGSGQAGWSQS